LGFSRSLLAASRALLAHPPFFFVLRRVLIVKAIQSATMFRFLQFRRRRKRSSPAPPALSPKRRFVIHVAAERGEFSLPGLDRFQGLAFDNHDEAEAYCRSADRLYGYRRYEVVELD
jgi:hypothetical protein